MLEKEMPRPCSCLPSSDSTALSSGLSEAVAYGALKIDRAPDVTGIRHRLHWGTICPVTVAQLRRLAVGKRSKGS
jgi:hypothetical protein